MKNGQKAAAKNAEKKGDKKVVAFKKEVDNTEPRKDYTFFKFAVGTSELFVGAFKGILPETHALSGIEMLKYDVEKGEFSEEQFLLPNYHNLLQFFKKKTVNDSIVYQIKLLEEKELEDKNTVFLFEISSADLSETESEE